MATIHYTEAEKRKLYRAGFYVFEVPPACHARWTEADWIRYITGCNGWRPRTFTFRCHFVKEV